MLIIPKECEHEFELNSMPHRVTNLKYNLFGILLNFRYTILFFEKRYFKATTERNSSSTLIFVNCSQKINLLYSIVRILFVKFRKR